MPTSPSQLPDRPSLEQLRKQAKDLLRLARAGDSVALARLRAVVPRLADDASSPAILADAQLTIAREHGFASWPKLAEHVATLQSSLLRDLDQLAGEISAAYVAGDYEAIRDINARRGTSFVWDRDVAAMKRQLPGWFADGARDPALALADVRRLLARKLGYESWAELVASVTEQHPSRGAGGTTASFYRIDERENRLEVRRPLSDAEWDVVVSVIDEHGITAVHPGLVTDSGVARLSTCGTVTRLDLGSSTFTDDGLLHLARMPQLRELDLSGWKSPVTDRGLEVLANLPELRTFRMCWPQRVTDAGFSNLEFCDHLEVVDLLGTSAGDGAIRALAGKQDLRVFKTGRGVTDAGIPHLHRIPAFAEWRGGEIEYGLMSADAGPTHLLLDGAFSDAGFAGLAGLEGLFGISLFWHTSALTSNALAGLKALPNLGYLGCDGKLCDDVAMRHIAAIPRLRMLMGQGAVATDDGFAALATSQTIEYFWGRDCPTFGTRGFMAMAAMPSLRGLAVSLKNVDDTGLSMLPSFPALTKLMPMDVKDAGFRHVGRCERLDSLWCMYCRDTGDVATEHIRNLPRLETYYAGSTLITDRSCEILAGMASLERVEFWSCVGLTNAGVRRLARLPRLRELGLDGLPQVTRDVGEAFPASVRVSYSP